MEKSIVVDEQILQLINCHKFNYKDGIRKKDVNLSYSNNLICYSYKKVIKDIPISKIIGLIYGCKSTTFQLVNKCVPWRCFSLVLTDRTYDFEADNYIELFNFCKLLPPNSNKDLPNLAATLGANALPIALEPVALSKDTL